MPMDAEAVFVDPVDIVVLAYVDAIAIVVDIAAPDEVVVPERYVVVQVVGEEGVGTKDGRWEGDFLFQQFLGHHSAGGLEDIFLEEVPAVFEFFVDERLVEVPVLVVEAGFADGGVDAESLPQVTDGDVDAVDGGLAQD